MVYHQHRCTSVLGLLFSNLHFVSSFINNHIWQYRWLHLYSMPKATGYVTLILLLLYISYTILFMLYPIYLTKQLGFNWKYLLQHYHSAKFNLQCMLICLLAAMHLQVDGSVLELEGTLWILWTQKAADLLIKMWNYPLLPLNPTL